MENSRKSHDQSNFPKMKIMQFVQKILATAGISRTLAAQAYPLDRKISIGLLILVATLASNILYIIHVANSFFEYTQAGYMISMAIVAASFLLILVLKANRLFELIENFENLINTSEYKHRTYLYHVFIHKIIKTISALKYTATKAMFYQTIQIEEKLIEIVFHVMVDVTPVLATLPRFIYSYFVYVTTDLGYGAFGLLPLPVW